MLYKALDYRYTPISYPLFDLSGFQKELWLAVEFDIYLSYKSSVFHIRIKGSFEYSHCDVHILETMAKVESDCRFY